MAKTIVSIVSDQTLPNYIFIKEMYKPGDSLLFISSEKMYPKVSYIISTLAYTDEYQVVLLEDENNWEVMKAQICSQLSSDTTYIVNLTGGTKFMALAVKEAFENFQSNFAYIPLPQNVFMSPQSAISVPIKYRVSVKEYLSLYGLKLVSAGKQTTQSLTTTNNMFTLFTEKQLSPAEFDIIDKLRAYRDYNIDISTVETKDGTDKKPQIPGLCFFLNFLERTIGLVWERQDNKLHKEVIQYLTGGWFEEYIYHLMTTFIKPTDIQLGMLISSKNTTDFNNKNDLDVVFTKGNKLFVVECKTGIPNGKLSAFKEIVNKATALNQTLLGLYAQSFIFALCSEKQAGQFTSAAQYMRINFYNTPYFIDAEKRGILIKTILQLSND